MNKQLPYIHLHTHTELSLLDGMSRTEELIDQAKVFNMNALAVTNHGNLFNITKFYKQCIDEGIKPILGMEAYTRKDLGIKDKDEKPGHLILLAQNNEGWRNLKILSTRSYTEGFYKKPCIDRNLLAQNNEGLIILSGCLNSDINKAVLAGQFLQADRLIEWYATKFPGRFYLELQPHLHMSDQVLVNEYLLDASKQKGIPAVLTCDSHYVKEQDHELHKIWLMLAQDADESSQYVNWSEGCWFRPGGSIDTIPDSAISITQLIADQCNVEIPLGKTLWPKFPVPSGYKGYDDYLSDLCINKCMEYTSAYNKDTNLYLTRLRKELDTIKQLGFSVYFLLVQDYTSYARCACVPVGSGRGSGVGSLVAFLTGITSIDPIEHNIMFERFLTPGRKSLPDIDVDFSTSGVEKVYKYLIQKYGEDNIARIGTFATVGARQALRDTARILNSKETVISKEDVNSIKDLIPDDPDLDNKALISLEAACEISNDLRDLREKSDSHRQWFKIAESFIGLHRQGSVHASGVVISPDPIHEHVPLYVRNETKISQYDMNVIELSGLLKFDLLRIDQLDVVQKAIDFIDRPDVTANTEFPLDDERTFALLRSGKTKGVFQLGTRLMRNLLRDVKPTCFFDVVATVSLGRTAILQAKAHERFIARKNGKEEVDYPDPRLQPILEETYGIILFQDQALQIAVEAAGYDWLEADKLRKILGKKIKSQVQEEKEKFVNGCIANNYSKEVANDLFEKVAYFAGYGFGKGHAVGYGHLSYTTAYLKANFPAEYMSALISVEAEGGTDREKLKELLDDCRDSGLVILSPDINDSLSGFDPVQGTKYIQYGLRALPNVGVAAVREIEKHRPYGSFDEFLEKTRALTASTPRGKGKGRFGSGITKQTIHNLIYAGAFDKFGQRDLLMHQFLILNETVKYKRQALIDVGPTIQPIKQLIVQKYELCMIPYLGIVPKPARPAIATGIVTKKLLNQTSKTNKPYHKVVIETSTSPVQVYAFGYAMKSKVWNEVEVNDIIYTYGNEKDSSDQRVVFANDIVRIPTLTMILT